MLRDRLVCGIEDGRIQRWLLSEPEIVFKKAFDIAQAMESAERNAQDLQTKKGEGIHMVGEDGVPNKNPLPTDNVLRLIGESLSEQPETRRDSNRYRRGIHVVSGEGEVVNGDPFPEYNLYNVRDSNLASLRIHARVSGADLEMEIDTGATRSVISKANFEQIWIPGNAPALKNTASRESPIPVSSLKVHKYLQLRHAHGVSQIPLPESPANTPVQGETILLVDNMELFSLNFRKVRQLTDSGQVLSRVRLSLQRGWGIFDDNSLLHFERKKDELSVHDECILRGQES
ncbi:hypothetical protein LOD99_12154 [Oopsacas minuta]|uniref:Peptidase A2 domain-containing protein n=1 Tax=Oopsacas minuta TaxID=111878 RepID=A0AAV7JHK7_9METZ|nr:hypothetical protein LOD99_12154 [Oopsacas minuta]